MPPAPASQPRCAICVRPITKEDQFVLSATEVFHLACVKRHGTERSVVNRLKKAVADLDVDKAKLTYEVERLRADAQRYERDHDRLMKAERDVARLTLQLAEGSAREADYRRQRDEARRERDDANAARDAAQRELQLHQTLAGQRSGPAPATSSDPPSKQETLEDSQEKRFGLLELD